MRTKGMMTPAVKLGEVLKKGGAMKGKPETKKQPSTKSKVAVGKKAKRLRKVGNKTN